jgi:hypothetical protein
VALDLALQPAEVALTLPSGTAAWQRPAHRLEELRESPLPPAARLNVIAHIVALHREAGEPHQDTVKLESELRSIFDALPDESLGEDPMLARWAASVLPGRQDVGRHSRVLRLCGLPRADEPGLRQLAGAIAQFDLGVSKDLGKTPGVLANELEVPKRDSLTAAWGDYLLTASDSVLRDTLVRLLDENADFVPPDLVQALAAVMRSTMGVQTRASYEALETPTRHSSARSGQIVHRSS